MMDVLWELTALGVLTAVGVVFPVPSLYATAVVSALMPFVRVSGDVYPFVVTLAVVWTVIALVAASSREGRSRIVAASVPATAAGGLTVLTSGDLLSFLVGWEVMTLASFGALARGGSRRAFAYLFLGEVAFLLAAVGLLYKWTVTGTVDPWTGWGAVPWAALVLGLAAVIKMEVFPFHVMAPRAYEEGGGIAAALVSGTVTAVGAYVLLRVATSVHGGEWAGLAAVIVGTVSAFFGSLFASGSHGVRELLGYTTVAHNGTVLALVGTALAAAALGDKVLGAFALTIACYYVMAHALAKGPVLALTAGGSTDFDADDPEPLGPVARKAAQLCLASLAAVPPLPGFLAEWGALESMFQSLRFPHAAAKVIVVAAGTLQALAAGLGVVALTKAAVHWFQRSPGRRPDARDLAGAMVLVGLPAISVGAPWVMERFELPKAFGVGPSRFLGGLLAVPKGWLVKSGHGFGAVSPTFLALMMAVISGPVTFAFFLRVARKTRETKPWSGGLSDPEYPAAAHSAILLLTQGWAYGTDERDLSWRDPVERLVMASVKRTRRLLEGFSRGLMPGKDTVYVLYILIALLAVMVAIGA